MKTLKFSIIFVSLALLSGCSSSALIAQKNKSKNTTVQNVPKNYFTDVNTPSFTTNSQISRYVTVKDAPTSAEINPLLAVSTFIFQTSVVTVGDAVNQVLLTSGYQLAPNLSHDVIQTLRQPLPITDRELGPMPVQSALMVLMGESVYELQEDNLHRLINFKLKQPSDEAVIGDNND